MRIEHSDPDIETLARRIYSLELDLQPDFQRGEVWSVPKKRRLIDSILRNWHIPAIHIVANKIRGCDEVLDGQQRLAAIRDFLQGKLEVDGTIEPVVPEVQKLHGKRYSELPAEIQRQINRYTIRVFRLSEYAPQEPAELFFRLNQPANLAPAEQRNAFYGPVRDQIRKLVTIFAPKGREEGVLGFTNARMAYDDILAKVCFYLEEGSLQYKASAQTLASRYRSDEPFSEDIVGAVGTASRLLAAAHSASMTKVKFNKATLLSWLCFLVDANTIKEGRPGAEELARFMSDFELTRRYPDAIAGEQFGYPEVAMQSLLYLYGDRATSRVADVTSVLVRDFVVWSMFYGLRKYVNGEWAAASEKGALVEAACESIRKAPQKCMETVFRVTSDPRLARICQS